MINLQSLTDKSAIGFSMICAVHCLLFPVAIVLFPSVAMLAVDSEAFHQGILFAILPVSLIALTMGCRKHKRYQLFIMGAVGLTLVVLAVYLGHDRLGEWGEKMMTLAGSVIIALSHVKNFRLCQQQC